MHISCPLGRFPAQEHITGSSKIPTVLYYDKDGAVRAIGEETLTEGTCEMAEEEGWIKVEWFVSFFRLQEINLMNDIRFKLYLQPNTASTREIMQKLPPLSPKKQAVDILADFLRYMYACARTYIEESHAYGTALWTSVEDGIHDCSSPDFHVCCINISYRPQCIYFITSSLRAVHT